MARWLELGEAHHRERRILGMSQDLSQEQEIRWQVRYRNLSQVLHWLENHREFHQ